MRTNFYTHFTIAIFGCFVLSPVANAITEEGLCDLYVEVVEDAVEYYEPLWTDESNRIPNSGFFDFRKYGNWRDDPYATIIIIPGNGMVDFCYSVLLTETDKQTFTKKKIPRKTLLNHAIQSIRWCCLTSAYVENPYYYMDKTRPEFLEGDHWRRVMGYRADEVGWLTLAAAKLWNLLDEETKKLVEDVMIGGAPKERLVRSWYTDQAGNHDQVKQDLSSTIGAAYLFPERADSDMYMEIIAGNAIDMVSTLQDLTCDTMAGGKPIREWAKGWNLYQDYSSDHHGWLNVWYGGDMLFEGRCYVELMSGITGRGVPETFTYKGNGFDGVLEWLKTLCLPEGEPASPHGNEYDTYYGAGLLGYCYGAVVNKDPVAAAMEERAAGLLMRQTRAVQQYDYHRNSWAKAATAYLMHKYAGPGAEPVSFDDACRVLDGSYHYRQQQYIIHRAMDKWTSFSWGSASHQRVTDTGKGSGLCGIIIPTRMNDTNPEPLVYCHPRSMIGKVAITNEKGEKKEHKFEPLYNYHYRDDGFSAAGVVSDPYLNRYYAYFSFANGPSVLYTVFQAKQNCCMSWSGLPIYFYEREGFTSSRNFLNAETEQPLEIEGTRRSEWWNVNETLGLVSLGGNNLVKTERCVGYNWARQETYRDKCMAVYTSPIENQMLQAGEIGPDLAAAFYINAENNKMDIVQEEFHAISGKIPEGWRGYIARDAKLPEKRFFTIANLYGTQEQCIIQLSMERGAPVSFCESIIEGNKAQIPITLKPSESLGEVYELYVSTEGNNPLRARRLSENRYLLEPMNAYSVSTTIRYRGEGADLYRICDANGKCTEQIPNNNRSNVVEFLLRIERPTIIELCGKDYDDHIGPSVEIADISIRDDGRATIEVNADDQSGIDYVELYCDGELVDRKFSNSFVWTHRPGEGPHTYYAIAADLSPQRNIRKSFARTVIVSYSRRPQ